MIAWHAGVIAPLVAGLRFGGAPAALELVAQEWGGAFGVAMQVMYVMLLPPQAVLPIDEHGYHYHRL